MTDDAKKKIVQLFKDGTTPKRRPAPPKAGNVVSVSGNGNVVAGGDVHYHAAAQPVTGPVLPGVEHVTAEQRKILRKLVEDIGETEARLKRNPKGYAAVYTSLFRRFAGVKKLEQIPLDGFEEARSYLQQWLGRLNAMPSAPVKNVDDWRKRRYAYIKSNSKDPEDDAALAAYIKRHFGADSIRDLTNDELERAYRYIAGRRSRRR